MEKLNRYKKVFLKIDRFIGTHKIYHFIDVFYVKFVCGLDADNYFAYEFYNKSRLLRKTYMTGKQRIKLENKNNSQKDISVLLDKYQFDLRFREYLHRDFLYLKETTFEEFYAFSMKHPTFIAKKNWLCEGQGVSREHLSNASAIEEYYHNNKESYLLLEEEIIQHPKLSQLHPQSVNTCRVSTLFHNGKPHIVAAALRIGTGEEHTDNLHNSGIACAVDIESGIVISRGYDKDAFTYLKHPDSKITLLGFKIPNWEKVLNTVTQAAQLIPTLKWVGWDVAITEEACVLVEGNTNQSEDLIQIGQGGLLPKIRKIQEK